MAGTFRNAKDTLTKIRTWGNRDQLFSSNYADTIIVGKQEEYEDIYTLAGDDVVTLTVVSSVHLGLGNDKLNMNYISRWAGDYSGASVYGGDGNDSLIGGILDDELGGNNGFDSITGGDGSDEIYGGGDKDDLLGGNGSDILYGDCGYYSEPYFCDNIGYKVTAGAGDLINGGTGNDTIIGSEGMDTLIGGTGQDEFVYENIDEIGDIINDFETGNNGDLVLLSNIFWASAFLINKDDPGSLVKFEQSGSDTLLKVDQDGVGNGASFKTLATLKNVMATKIDMTQIIVGSPISVVNNLPTGSITINGSPTVGSVLTTSSSVQDADGLGKFSYEWSNDLGVLSTAATIKLTENNIGSKIKVTVKYIDLLGTAEQVTSNPTAAVSISNKPTEGSDLLTGTNKADNISALAGNDTLIGGLGKDALTGGTGSDVFKFNDVTETGSTSRTSDSIVDFKSVDGDKIDLSSLAMANGVSLTFIGSNQFDQSDATGELRFDSKSHILYGSINADNKPEFAILIAGVSTLTDGDFIL